MPHGTVIVIGGAEDKVRDRVILGRFVALAGGPEARIAVIATASSFGMEAGERYRSVFTELGAAEVVPLNAVSRAQANDEHAARIIARLHRHLHDRRQPAPPLVDAGRDPPRRRDHGPLQGRCGGRGHLRRGERHLVAHDRVRGLGCHAQAPDGADRRGPRAAARA